MSDSTPAMELWTPETPQDWQEARQLLVEYRDDLGVDLAFQGFDQELAALPLHYLAPGELFLLASIDGGLAGCCALRALPELDEVRACEMKRLYVRPAFRGFGLGRAMAEILMRRAHEAQFCTLLLDTLGDMQAARPLRQPGFCRDRALPSSSAARGAFFQGGPRGPDAAFIGMDRRQPKALEEFCNKGLDGVGVSAYNL